MTQRRAAPNSNGLVFIVDDDELLCELHTRWLEAKGFEVLTFFDGEACLTGLTEALPDAIGLDLAMPKIDGMETSSVHSQGRMNSDCAGSGSTTRTFRQFS